MRKITERTKRAKMTKIMMMMNNSKKIQIDQVKNLCLIRNIKNVKEKHIRTPINKIKEQRLLKTIKKNLKMPNAVPVD